MEDTEKFTSNNFPVLGDSGLVDTALKGSHELISILFDHESHELLLKRQSGAVSQRHGMVQSTERTHLCDIQIGLHDEEGVQGIGTGRVGVVEEIFDLRERRLPETWSSIFRGDMRLRMSLFETKWFRGMCKRSNDPRVESLHFFEPCGEELPLWRRTLVHPDAHQYLAKQSENS